MEHESKSEIQSFLVFANNFHATIKLTLIVTRAVFLFIEVRVSETLAEYLYARWFPCMKNHWVYKVQLMRNK